MQTSHEIKITVIPICTHCGNELRVGGCQFKTPTGVFDRDDPWNRTTQTIFVYACPDCFVFKGDIEAIEVKT